MPVPSGATFLGVSREITRGTYRAPTDFLPIDNGANSPNDLPHTTQDTNMRGSAVDSYDTIATQIWAEPDYSGNVFVDTIGFLLKALLGDERSFGVGGSTTTLAAPAAAGATSVSLTADPGAVGTVIQIDTSAANSDELRIITSKSGGGPYTIGFATPLDHAHLTGVNVKYGVGPAFTHKMSVLNSGNYQPFSLSVTDYNGDATKGIPGALVASLGLKWTSTGLVTWDGKLVALQSANQSKPTPSYGVERAKPGYQSVTTLGGTPITNNSDGEITITRNIDVVPSCGGVQDPYAIWGGNVAVKGKINLIYEAAVFAAEYAKLKASTPTILDLNWTSGASTTLRALECQMSNVIYTTGVPKRGKTYVELPLDFDADSNTTDVAGPSAGYSPILVTLTNNRGEGY